METSYVSIDMDAALHNGDHARTTKSPFQRLNLLDWINSPKKFSKGMNIEAHLKTIYQFIERIDAQTYAAAILTNSLEEDCQLELFSNPAFDEKEDSFEIISNLLRKIFGKTQTEISNMVTLFAEKQEASESVTAFLSRLRVKAYKLTGFRDKKEKEGCILNAFINGLKDRRIAKAVELIKPNDSESALFVAEKEENKQTRHQENVCFNITAKEGQHDHHDYPTDVIKEMSQQIKLLSQQVAYLTNLIKTTRARDQSRNQELQPKMPVNQSISRRTYADAAKSRPMPQVRPFQQRPREEQNRQTPKNVFQCWNCKKNGHSWRNCWKQIICQNCFSTGHVSRFCRQKDALRYFEVEDEAEEVQSLDEKLSVITEEADEVDDCLIMQGVEKLGKKEREQTKPCNTRMNRKMKSRSFENERNIDEWVNYINGKQQERPKYHYAPTVISETRSETAANKPLVLGECGGKSIPILIDSGAALNVIDESFVKEFGDKVKMKSEALTIRCANNGKVASLGKVFIKVKIGSHEEFMKFSVIRNLFPKVIIGLRQMKHSDMVVDAKYDSIWIKNEEIKFISKTKPVHPENQ